MGGEGRQGPDDAEYCGLALVEVLDQHPDEAAGRGVTSIAKATVLAKTEETALKQNQPTQRSEAPMTV